MHTEIVMIGTELLLGELVDTNANKLARALRNIGLDLYYKTTVGDNEARITEVLNLALDRSDVVITSGGLGPTVDDVTRQAVANATGRKLVYSSELEAQIAARFRSFGRKMADNNKRQAYIPEGALPLTNPVGTAPCFLSEDVRGRGFIVTLPGVPRELEYMMENTVIPLLVERMGGVKVTKVRILRTCAVGESNVDAAIGDLMTTANPTVGLAAHVGQTDVRITAKADTEAEADALIARMEAKLRERLGVAIYGVEKETVPEVVGRLLSERNLMLGVVDTLTGGQLARDLIEAGFGPFITTHLNPANVADALKASGLDTYSHLQHADDRTLVTALAESVTPADGLGLAMLGPFEENSTFIALNGPGGIRLFERGRNFQGTDYILRWFVIQGLDWIRRTVLGQLRSPVDWNMA
ncbi:CinA family nicotinamide mononucleotide deamidase-related protein [Candidatus Poribacteria bacterium]|nr:CinA family nicotinamide mononucleotide deamidase-related protein [Candidatus Poribacteria bacterium]